jgi:CheY-like chemotaxis protein
LLIDDDPDMHSVVQMVLEPDGYEIVCCRTAAEGLARMHERKPDLLLLDIMLMHPVEGLQVACQMRQDGSLKDIPIVFVSTMGQSVGSERAKEVCPETLDFDLFLEKPLDAGVVRETVKQALQQRSPQA